MQCDYFLFSNLTQVDDWQKVEEEDLLSVSLEELQGIKPKATILFWDTCFLTFPAPLHLCIHLIPIFLLFLLTNDVVLV